MRITISAVLICGLGFPALAQDVSEVRQASQRFAAAMSSGDGNTAASMFTDDALVLPPGRELKTKPEISMFLNNMARNVQNLQFTTQDVLPNGDTGARELGTLSFKTKGRNGRSPRDVNVKYLLVWNRIGSDWKISAEMWNQNGPGPGRQGAGKRRGGGAQNGGAGGGTDPVDEQ